MRTSLLAALIGLFVIALFMIVVYRIPGLASVLALVIYTCLIVICLNIFELTLTLPGIAGIILSIGMAVDANVIIFARVRRRSRLESQSEMRLTQVSRRRSQRLWTVT